MSGLQSNLVMSMQTLHNDKPLLKTSVIFSEWERERWFDFRLWYGIRKFFPPYVSSKRLARQFNYVVACYQMFRSASMSIYALLLLLLMLLQLLFISANAKKKKNQTIFISTFMLQVFLPTGNQSICTQKIVKHTHTANLMNKLLPYLLQNRNHSTGKTISSLNFHNNFKVYKSFNLCWNSLTTMLSWTISYI